MASKTTIAVALMSAMALGLAGTTLALYLAEREGDPDVQAVAVTATVAKTVTETSVKTLRERAGSTRLSDEGELLWQLEALLRDTFGGSEFYLHYGNEEVVFDREFTGNCCSEYWTFLFPDAEASRLWLAQPDSALPVQQGASSGAVPVRVLGDFVACEGGGWLYAGTGNAVGPNFTIFCERPA